MEVKNMNGDDLEDEEEFLIFRDMADENGKIVIDLGDENIDINFLKILAAGRPNQNPKDWERVINEIENSDNYIAALTVLERYFKVFYISSSVDNLERFCKVRFNE
jgi:hypothetical protein